jgi:hypothetical protein
MIVEHDPAFNKGSILFWISGFLAVAVFFVGLYALLAPVPGSASFGAPVTDATNTQGLAWVRLMGVRDIGLAVILLALMVVKARRIAGLMLLLLVIIPIVDCATVIHALGITYHILVHGGSAVLMLILGALLLRPSPSV